MTRDELDAALLAAHAAGDGVALSNLYAQAADAAQDVDAACFYLTHAFVFALEEGLPEAKDYEAQLRRHGRV